MKKIGIATLFYKNYNYGGVLQAYALQHYLKMLGFDAKIIIYDDKKNINPIYPTLLSRCSQYSLNDILSKVFEICIARANYNIKSKLHGRIALFDSFVEQNIEMTKQYKDATLCQLGHEFDVIISGSDQVWNPNAIRHLYMQDFQTEKEYIRMSYAASISREYLSPKESKIMIDAIKRFDFVSVREKTASDLLVKGNVQNIKIVADPTMLLDAEKWNNLASVKVVDTPYVLVYSFSDCPFKRNLVDYFSKKGITVYYIPYAKQVYNTFDMPKIMNPLWDVGPSEFLSLIRNAECVFTDSFHGTVFSILFNRNFVVYERDKSGKTSKNSRMYDLLATFGLSSRLVKNSFTSVIVNNINYTSVNKILSIMRNESANWLKNAIKQSSV